MAGDTARYADEPPLSPDQIWSPLPMMKMPLPGLDLSVAFGDTGGSGPPLLLVHGLSSYTSFWEHQIHVLARRHRVLVLDLPGFGASDKPDVSYTPGWYARVLSRFLVAVGAPRAAVVGQSMGGQIALTLALQDPDRVSALVLAAPAGVETFSPEAAAWMKGYWTETRALEAGEAEVRTNFTKLAFNRVDEGVERLIRERVRLQRHPSFRATSRAVSRCIAGMLDQPVYESLPRISVPTLLVFGTADRMIPNPVFTKGTSAEIAERGQKAIPGARLALLERAGHMVQHDDPDGFHRAVEPFLASIRAS